MNPAIGKMDRLQRSGRERRLLHAGVSGFNAPAGVHGAGQSFEKRDFCFVKSWKILLRLCSTGNAREGQKKVTVLDCYSPKLSAAGC